MLFCINYLLFCWTLFYIALGTETASNLVSPHVYHSFRSIVGRRFFFIIGTLYLYRCITMYVTTLPVPGMHFQCAPKVRTSEGPFRGNQENSYWAPALYYTFFNALSFEFTASSHIFCFFFRFWGEEIKVCSSSISSCIKISLSTHWKLLGVCLHFFTFSFTYSFMHSFYKY